MFYFPSLFPMNTSDIHLVQEHIENLRREGSAAIEDLWKNIPAPNRNSREEVADWLQSAEGRRWKDAQIILNHEVCEIVHACGLWSDEVSYWGIYSTVSPDVAYLTQL